MLTTERQRQVAEVEQARMLTAMVQEIAERGAANVSGLCRCVRRFGCFCFGGQRCHFAGWAGGGACLDIGEYGRGRTCWAGEPYTPASPINFEIAGLVNVVQSFQAAEDGDAVTYIGEPPGSEGTGETGPGGGDQWLATRTSQGWKTGAITPASTTATAQFQVYQGFTPNLTIGFLEGGALQPAQPLGTATPEKSCRSLYTHELPPAAGAFDALFVKGDGAEYEPCGHPLFAGASSDSSQVIFQSEAPLTENAVEATEVPATREGPHQGHLGAPQESGEPCEFGCNLYDSVAGHLDLVNVLEGKTVPNATFGGYPDEAPTESTGFSNAISADGSRIFWTDTREKLPSSGEPDPDFEHVFVLENDTSKSV